MALQLLQRPLTTIPSFPATTTSTSSSPCRQCLCFSRRKYHRFPSLLHCRGSKSRTTAGIVFVGKEETELRFASTSNEIDDDDQEEDEEEDEDEGDPDPQDLVYISQIKRVLELLRKNRDMLFGEVKLTIMIEDPREVERKRLIGIDEDDAPTRDDLVAALEDVNEGKVPKNRVALRMLAEEMSQWPNLEVEAPKKSSRGKSLYAKATDTGINPQEAAKRLNMDWDSAAEIEDPVGNNEAEVPPAVGYGALYLVTAFPVIIGISVVLILFYNSLR